jgi:4'-phosphopantetheinyl transferase
MPHLISQHSLSFDESLHPEARACLAMISTDPLTTIPSSWIEHLSVKERLHYENCRYLLRQKQYLLGRYCAKLAIGKQLDLSPLSSFSIDSGIFRQPIIRDICCSGVMVSLSHSEHSAIALAFYDRYVCGVDIETVSIQKADLIRPLLTIREKELLANLEVSEEESMLLAWCAKESLSKALRTGLSLPFELLEIDSIQIQGIGFDIRYINFIQYSSLSLIHYGHVISITKPKDTSIHGLTIPLYQPAI